MKPAPQCAACLLSRVQFEAALSTDDYELQMQALKTGLRVLASTFEKERSTNVISTQVHREVYETLNDSDPYLELKKLSNTAALRLLPSVKNQIRESEDPFRDAVVAVTIGNTLDFGVQGFKAPIANFNKVFKELGANGLAIDDTDEIRKLASGDVTYLTDNCGEIVLDTLLFEQIHALGGTITLVVRGAPILNDATIEDVQNLGIEKQVDRVLTTGSNAVGICMKEVPDEVRVAIESADIIISKGMANYESLTEHNYRPIAYLMQAKCKPVAESVPTAKGDLIAKIEI
ncbi:hypothetical protein B6V01_003195 [Methanosarcinales archaeon ex4572_44]|nr:MAG: hypothetical protein B6V01_003195 [Methanosarcinales archaeon ex4572_44]RLG26692.1 MAG: hypothetical protein DRN85_02320 [Methanosarcinales archaeon]HHI30429.1 DUF89 family protein [Candidatus Methanoperedenaceae archaeon]